MGVETRPEESASLDDDEFTEARLARAEAELSQLRFDLNGRLDRIERLLAPLEEPSLRLVPPENV